MDKIVRNQRISKVGEILLATVAVTGTIALLAVLPGLAVAIRPFIKKKKYAQKQSVNRNIESLLRQSLITRSIARDGSVTLALTRRGRWEAMIRHGKIATKSNTWDMLWRVVIFDIPNEKTKTRNELRRAMVHYGFLPIQKSVWVYPYQCDDFISLLKSHLGVSNDVLFMTVKYIENDKNLKKEFKL